MGEGEGVSEVPGRGRGGRVARWWAMELLGWRGQAPLSMQQVRAGARAGGLVWAGTGREGPRQASVHGPR